MGAAKPLMPEAKGPATGWKKLLLMSLLATIEPVAIAPDYPHLCVQTERRMDSISSYRQYVLQACLEGLGSCQGLPIQAEWRIPVGDGEAAKSR